MERTPPINNRANRPKLGAAAIAEATRPAGESASAPAPAAGWAEPQTPSQSRRTPGSHRLAALLTPPIYAPQARHFSPPSGYHVTGAAVDYFTLQTGDHKSYRAAINLSLMVGGRILIALGLGGVYTGLHQDAWPISLGGVAMACGSLGIALGGARFYYDTVQFNHRLARAAAYACVAGILLSTGGGVFYTWAHSKGDKAPLYVSVAIRTVGNVVLFGAMPSGFSASEIVWGDTPLTNRVALRDGSYANGVGLLMAWAHVSSPDPPAPLWAREALQCLGMALVATGASLARTDLSREAATQRHTARARRASSAAAVVAAAEAAQEVGPRNELNPGETPSARGPRHSVHQRAQDFLGAVLPALLGRAQG